MYLTLRRIWLVLTHRPTLGKTTAALLIAGALVPVVVVLGAALLLGDLGFGLARRLRRSRPAADSAATAHRRASIIVLNWDGRDLLARGLPSILTAIERHGEGHEVIVVDNGSADDSVELVRREFPSVRVCANGRNLRFTGGNNAGVRAARNEIVVLLNNDMVVHEDFLAPLLAPFDDPNVFAVSSQIFFWDETRLREETGRTRARFEDGGLVAWHEQVSADDAEVEPVFWAGGGSCAIDRAKFLALGGLDTLYDPFYVEDTDLSYRAWKRGWTVLFAPASKVYHKHRGTNKPKFGDDYVDNAIRKNNFLFVWRNITDLDLTIQTIVCLPIRLLRLMVLGRLSHAGAFLWALRQFPEAFVKRYQGRWEHRRSDREVFRVSSHRAHLDRLAGRAPGAGYAPAVEFSQPHQRQLGAGWHDLEIADGRAWRWMGREAKAFLQAAGGEGTIAISGFAAWPDRRRKTLPLSVALNGLLLARQQVPAQGDFTVAVGIPAGLLSRQDLCEVTLAAATFNPRALGLGDDGRDLSLGVTRIALQ